MPRTVIDPNNKPAGTDKFPKLKLKNGEKERIVLMEMSPETNWVHNFNAPKVINGEVKTKTDPKFGEVYDMEFFGNPICLGDFDTVASKGIDPDHCPACEAHQQLSDLFDPPKRRYALPILKYDTDDKGKIVPPFGCRVVVWAFPDKIFATLCDFQEEWGDMRQHDINLGPCENETFQKFDINVAGGDPAWGADDDSRQRMAAVWKDQQPTEADLIGLCGKVSRRDYMQVDIEKVKERWAEVRRLEGKSSSADELLSNMEKAQVATQVTSKGAIDFEAMLAGGTAAEPAQAAPVPSPELGNDGVGTGGEFDLDAALSDLQNK